MLQWTQSIYVHYATKSDEELVEAAQTGDVAANNYLLFRYRSLIMSKAKSYFIAGADRDDIIQEGLIGLYKAVTGFCPLRGTSFRPFAEMCVTRQIITAVKAASRQKHSPLNFYLSLDKPLYTDGSERQLLDILPDERITDPAEVFLMREQLVDVWACLRCLLSEFEYDVFTLYLNDQSYNEIAFQLNATTKAVDNALCRAKRKIEGKIADIV